MLAAKAGLRVPAFASGSPSGRFHATLGMLSPAHAVTAQKRRNEITPRLRRQKRMHPPEEPNDFPKPARPEHISSYLNKNVIVGKNHEQGKNKRKRGSLL